MKQVIKEDSENRMYASPLSHLSDEELAARLSTGDVSPLGELYRRYAGMVEGAIRRFAQHANRAEVEDLAQEVFLALPAASQGYMNEAKFKAWLYGVTIRRTKCWRKKHAIRNALFKRRMSSLIDEHPVPVTPEKTAALRDLIHKLFRRLPKNQQDALFLHEGEGFTAKEIAEILNVSENAIWTRIHRARKTLQKKLKTVAVEAFDTSDTPSLLEVRS